MTQKIIILDFGSQTTQLIGRRVRELDTFCEILPYNKFPKDDPSVIGVILIRFTIQRLSKLICHSLWAGSLYWASAMVHSIFPTPLAVVWKRLIHVNMVVLISKP